MITIGFALAFSFFAISMLTGFVSSLCGIGAFVPLVIGLIRVGRISSRYN
jgi:uncharacterized membrane protein YfcA